MKRLCRVEGRMMAYSFMGEVYEEFGIMCWTSPPHIRGHLILSYSSHQASRDPAQAAWKNIGVLPPPTPFILPFPSHPTILHALKVALPFVQTSNPACTRSKSFLVTLVHALIESNACVCNYHDGRSLMLVQNKVVPILRNHAAASVPSTDDQSKPHLIGWGWTLCT